MSIQEKKSTKGTPYAIIKFSDKKREFELFLFAEVLISNREKIKESESFVLTLQKDSVSDDNSKKRINVKKILSLDEMINKPYSNITIKLKENFKINEIKEILSKNGETKVNLIFKYKNSIVHYSLKNLRKFDLSRLKSLKSKEYIEKISV